MDTILLLAVNLIGGRVRPQFIVVDRAEVAAWLDLTGDQHVFAHFKDFPLLQVIDCTALLPLPLKPGGFARSRAADQSYYDALDRFCPRVYTTSLFLTPVLWCGVTPAYTEPSYSSSQWKKNHGITNLHRFTKPSSLIDEIRRLGCQIRWKYEAPRYPFQLMSLEEVIKSANVPPPPVQNVETLVNGEISCTACWDCLNPPMEDAIVPTTLCRIHIQRLCSLKNLTTSELVPLWDELTWQLDHPAAKPEIQALLQHDPNHIWAVDFEGIPLLRSGLAPLPTEVGIVNIGTGKSYSGFIRYPGITTTRKFITILQQRDAINFRSGVFKFHLMTVWVQSQCKGHDVASKTPAQHKKALIELGFDEDRALVFNWGTTPLDSLGLGRILREEGELVVARGQCQPRCKTIDIMTLFRRCIDMPSMSLSLKSVWHMLYPQEKVVNLFWHSALWMQ